MRQGKVFGLVKSVTTDCGGPARACDSHDVRRMCFNQHMCCNLPVRPSKRMDMAAGVALEASNASIHQRCADES
jgi:hypothetical protein